MKTTQSLPQHLTEHRLADAWADLLNHPAEATVMQANAYRLAFADPEFMLRRETRGLRIQLEMLKPDLDQAEQGIEHTVVVFGSARFVSPEAAQAMLRDAQTRSDPEAIKVAQRHMRNAEHYEHARLFAHMVANYSQAQSAEKRLYICTGGGPASWKRPTAARMR